MNIPSFKKLVSKNLQLCSVQVSQKLLVVWTKMVDQNLWDFPFRLVCFEEAGQVNCSAYHTANLCYASLVGSIEDALRVLDEFTKLKLCEGVLESDVKTDVGITDVLICKYRNQFLYRSRGCKFTVKETSICAACCSLTNKKFVHLKPNPAVSQTKLKHCCSSQNCDKSFSSRVTLSKHVRQDHVDLYKCVWEDCGKHFGSQRTLDTHVKRHLGDFSQFCSDCGKGFVTVKELKLHQVFHRKEKEFECEVCGKKFHRKLSLADHMNLHTGNKNFLCNQCGASFARLANLKDHRHRQHGGEKKYPCDQCDKKFHAQQQLIRHKRVHTGEKPYPCHMCDKKFSRDHHLRNHVKQLHSMNQEAVAHYDIPSPSQTLVIHTSSLPESGETEENLEPAPTLFYHEGDPGLVHVDIQEHITLIHLDS